MIVEQSQPHKGALPLAKIATAHCTKFSSLITDLGKTPFHLIKPVLEKLSAKHLDLLEEKSPHLRSHTDYIWEKLIVRDFPQRPSSKTTANTKLGSKRNGSGKIFVPSKALYSRYNQEREDMRKEAAERLRLKTQQLNLEKQSRTVTHLAELPSHTKKRPIHKSSILNRMRQDVNSRRIFKPAAPPRQPVFSGSTKGMPPGVAEMYRDNKPAFQPPPKRRKVISPGPRHDDVCHGMDFFSPRDVCKKKPSIFGIRRGTPSKSDRSKVYVYKQ